MKTPLTNLYLYVATALLAGSSLVACAQTTTPTTNSTAPTSAKTALLQPAQQMMTKMKNLQATGDPDFDYAFRAKVHLQGAQDLLKQEAQNGKDSSIKQMAQQLLTAAQTDAASVDAILKTLKPTRPNAAFAQQQSRNVEAMNLKVQQMSTGDRMTNDLDKNFVALYLDHRQDAVDMATNYLQYGKNESLRSLAQQLLTKAKTEMDQLKAIGK